tara:strand:+ start:3803 stop:3985 length:183 start_codon:yes stop_codon:yes gene_type:complete
MSKSGIFSDHQSGFLLIAFLSEKDRPHKIWQKPATLIFGHRKAGKNLKNGAKTCRCCKTR